MLERLAALLVTGFASSCAIDVLSEDGAITRVATAPDDCAPLPADAPHGAAVVMRTGEPELVGSYMCVPLIARDQPWGAHHADLRAARRSISTTSRLASELARRAAAAMETIALVESLERSEERYRMLFEASPLPMWVYDAETLQFLAVNEAAVRHYGYTRARVPRR